ncbi:hypothetical protein Pmani_004385 [Petrolisthes manimaculis]|uniref:C3H1-type domain-containing protein n=1 Tax=Petrolisthes manimaculis TaxID=1843537 RepID=A0AAE1QGG3_9EUCA|nr:hypothetical protein Pmani_032398 [Petrolisthes manimaculis]KAK4325003.1 hypothetical protein Pmani_004385 [Petrolisthes manimaculis]
MEDTVNNAPAKTTANNNNTETRIIVEQATYPCGVCQEIENCKSEEQEEYKSMLEQGQGQGYNPTNGTRKPDKSTTPTPASSNSNLDADTDHQEATPTKDAGTNREGQVPLDLDLETNIPLPSQARETETQLGLTLGRKHTNANPSSNTRNPRVCRYYRKGTCKHGVSGKGCKFYHPKPCQRLISHGPKGKRGCTLGSKCPNYHPILCRNSIQKQICVNKDSTYTHIRGTKREQREQEDPKNHSPSQQVSQRPQQQFAPRPPQQAQQRPDQTTTTTSHNIFLEMMLEMKHTMTNLSKVVEAQGLLLQNQIEKQINQTQLQAPIPPQMFPWLNAVKCH